MNDIKISVIVPVYNTEKYLKKCLDSIISQNLKDIEIIIVNDCSLDKSLEIIKKYMRLDKRITLINKEKNEGISSARNSGIKLARGEYILHIDSDDWIEQNYFFEMYNYAIKNNADIVISDFYREFENGRVVYNIEQGLIGKEKIDKEEVIENICQFKVSPCIWNKLIKTELYKKNNILFPQGVSIGEDLYVILKLIYFSKNIIKYDKAFLHYIQNPKGLTKNNMKNLEKIKDIHFVLKELEHFFILQNTFLSTNELKVNHLGFWLFKIKYDLAVEEYVKILNEYISILKKIDFEKIISKKIRFTGKILKVLNKKIIFVILWHFNNIFESFRNYLKINILKTWLDKK